MVGELIKIMYSIFTPFKVSLVQIPYRTGAVASCKAAPKLLLFLLSVMVLHFPGNWGMGGWTTEVLAGGRMSLCLSFMDAHANAHIFVLHNSVNEKALLPLPSPTSSLGLLLLHEFISRHYMGGNWDELPRGSLDLKGNIYGEPAHPWLL